jgi:hypothetical protein
VFLGLASTKKGQKTQFYIILHHFFSFPGQQMGNPTLLLRISQNYLQFHPPNIFTHPLPTPTANYGGDVLTSLGLRNLSAALPLKRSFKAKNNVAAKK